jgi:proline racemase
VTGDIAYGGAFYLYVDGGAFGLHIREVEAGRLKDFGMEVKDAANGALSVVHPEIPDIGGVYGAIISGAPRHPSSTQANACVFANRELDRSPTGSGTAGRIAQLHARGRLQRGETLVNESVIGSVFRGRILQETEVAGQPAVIPEIQGDAFICGFGNWTIDERDPLGYGFQLSGAGD